MTAVRLDRKHSGHAVSVVEIVVWSALIVSGLGIVVWTAVQIVGHLFTR